MSHIAQKHSHSLLLKRVTILFAKFMLIASLEHSTGRAASLALTNEFLIRGAMLMVRETRLVPEMSITFGAGDSDGRNCILWDRHTITAGMVTAVCSFSSARFLHALHTYLFAMAPVRFPIT